MALFEYLQMFCLKLLIRANAHNEKQIRKRNSTLG